MSSNDNNAYWDGRFKNDGLIWGDKPNDGALDTVKFFSDRNESKRILDIGCGYGRDTSYFEKSGFVATGVDSSVEAIEIGKRLYPNLKLDVGNIVNLPYAEKSFDILYGYYILHLLRKQDRSLLLRECKRVLDTNGYLIQTVASVNDSDYGQGEEFEENTFLSKRGVTKYFYSKDSLVNELSEFKIIKLEEVKIHHTHDEPHDHYNLFVIAQNT